MATDKIRKYVLPNIPYLFIGWFCLKIGTAYRLAAGADFAHKLMGLGQTIGVIMGSNIGTTLTAWLLSLTGIESDSFFVNLLKPKNFSPLLALAGILLIMGSKKQRRRDVGRVMMGFSILMYGMELMSGAVAPLADMPGFSGLMTAFTNPFLGVLVGAAFTGIIQSSAASVGILQALAMTGSVTYGMAIPIIMAAAQSRCP